MKYICKIIMLIMVITLMMSGCSPNQKDSDKKGESEGVGKLVLDKSSGDPTPPAQLLQEVKFNYDGELTPDLIASELSDYTGLNFAVKIKETEDGLIVDWMTNSTLLGGSDTEPKEDFAFHDVDTMSWFMMDSLWGTLTKNLDIKNVYYTMGDGKPLQLKNVSNATNFDTSSPYMGSAFYFAHSDVKGDNLSPVITDEDAALNLLTSTITVSEGQVIMSNLETEINGMRAWSFILGEDTPEKFTGSHFYTVSEDGVVYETDVTGNNEYVRIN